MDWNENKIEENADNFFHIEDVSLPLQVFQKPQKDHHIKLRK